jgi:hypothetical protein
LGGIAFQLPAVVCMYIPKHKGCKQMLFVMTWMSIERILMYVKWDVITDKPKEFEVQHPSQVKLRCRFSSAFYFYEVLWTCAWTFLNVVRLAYGVCLINNTSAF